MDFPAIPADKTETDAHPVEEPRDVVESFRTANAIFSMIALMPMHVSGAYRAAALPPGLLPKAKRQRVNKTPA